MIVSIDWCIVENTVSLLDIVASPWASVLQCIRSQCSDFGLAILDAVGYEGMDDGYACLTVPDQFRETWLNSHYGDLIRKAFSQVLGSEFKDYRIRLLAPSAPVPEMKLTPSIPDVVLRAKKAEMKAKANAVKQPSLQLYTKYTFENFVEGRSNSTAFRACEAVVENPGDQAMNPLLVYGASGLGKTHLLQAVAARIQATKPNLKVTYRQAYDFLRDNVSIVEAACRKQHERAHELLDQFRERYEECDVLLIDDIQLLEKGLKSQERLAILIRKLRSLGKQVVLSCDRHPSGFKKISADVKPAAGSNVPQLTANLLAPLESCVAVGLDEPDLNTRIDLIRKKSAELPFAESDREEICRYLSMAPRANIRVIEGLLNWLRAMHCLNNVELNLSTVKQMMGAQNSEASTAPLSLKGISEAVASSFHLDPVVLSSKRQDAGASLPRKIAMFLCRELTAESLQKIGEAFNRDYATVIASIKSLTKDMAEDAALLRRVNDLRYMLES